MCSSNIGFYSSFDICHSYSLNYVLYCRWQRFFILKSTVCFVVQDPFWSNLLSPGSDHIFFMEHELRLRRDGLKLQQLTAHNRRRKDPAKLQDIYVILPAPVGENELNISLKGNDWSPSEHPAPGATPKT